MVSFQAPSASPGLSGMCRGILDRSAQIGSRARPAEADSQQVMRSVIAALEFCHQGPPGRGARQPQGVHGRLAPRVAEGHLLYAWHHVAKQLGKRILVLVALPVMCPVRQRLPDRRFDLLRSIPEDQGREAKIAVQVFVVIHIPHPGALCPLHHHRKRIGQPEKTAHTRRHDRAVFLPDRQ